VSLPPHFFPSVNLHTCSHSNSRDSHTLSFGPVRSPSITSPPLPSLGLKTQAFYAVVLHDFISERPDELDAKAGDSISVVAQSNREWFVAKSIGRLGKPDLIPVSFVEVRDPTTGKPIPDVDSLMDSGTLPRVEDWKKQMLSYKANSIALGVLDDSIPTPATASPFTIPNTNPPSAPMTSALSYEDHDESSEEPETATILPDGLLLSARVVSFHSEMDEYWFRLHALYQPFDPSGSSTLPPAKDLVLFRAYNDFFEYQTTLLDTFPREAGREDKYPRIVPFMPGPTDEVDDALSATRRQELDDYLRRLCRLNRTTARYILQHDLTREFFALKPGDVERDTVSQYDLMAAVGWYDPLEDPQPVSIQDPPSPVDDVVRKLQQTSIKQPLRRHSDSEGSDYGDDLDPTIARSKSGGHSQRQPPHTAPLTHSKPHTARHVPPPGSARNGNGHHSSNSGQFRDSAYSRSSASSSSRPADSPLRSSSGARSTRSGGTTGASAGPPPISASNPQTAFIKIKIFDRIQDDLIAIRVHPRVTHEQLLDKVQQRLGGQVARLSYRESGEAGEDYVPLQQDDDVLWWIGSTDKHVLYAD
jgi:bud emergence protein 1